MSQSLRGYRASQNPSFALAPLSKVCTNLSRETPPLVLNVTANAQPFDHYILNRVPSVLNRSSF